MNHGNPVPEDLTFSDVRIRYRTGRSFRISQSGREKKYGYRHGVMTALGDLDFPEWERMVRFLIEKHGEQELQKQLGIWLHESNYAHETDKELAIKALELHAARIFDNRQWIGFISFNRRFRPAAVDEGSLVWIETPCCGTGQATPKQISRATSGDRQIAYPHCGRHGEFEIRTETKTKGASTNVCE
jgi:hypothetical protein